MACINMFNPAADPQQGLCSPRISFSNPNFVVDPAPPPPSHHDRASDPNFEFSVGTRPMIAADELFFKGRMLPLRAGDQRVTLRDELRVQDDEAWNSARPPKGSSSLRWKELLGLKKAGKTRRDAAAAAAAAEASAGKAPYQEECSVEDQRDYYN